MQYLRKRSEFLAVSRLGYKARRACLSLHRADIAALKRSKRSRRVSGDSVDARLRVGFTVTKKVGTATERSRVRRRLREAFKSLSSASNAGSWLKGAYVVFGRRDTLHTPFSVLVLELKSAAKQLTRRLRQGVLPKTYA